MLRWSGFQSVLSVCPPAQRGAALIELSLVTPFVVLLFVCLYNVVKTYSTTIPISNVSYQLAIVGSEYLPEIGESKINDRAARILFETGTPLSPIDAASFSVQTSYDEQRGTLQVRSAGSSSLGLLTEFGLGSSYQVVAPILAKRVVTSLDTSFASDPLCMSGYDCTLNCSTYGSCATGSGPWEPDEDTAAGGESVLDYSETTVDVDSHGNGIISKAGGAFSAEYRVYPRESESEPLMAAEPYSQ